MKSKLWLRKSIGAIIAVLVLFATGCTTSAGSSGSSTLRLSAGATGPFTEQFNPFLASSSSASGYSQIMIYEPLLMPNYSETSFDPWLASSFTWSKDGLTLTMKLQPDVMWSDGTPLTSEDVAFTFELMRKNEALNFNGLPLAGESAPSADTVKITFSEPGFQTLWGLTTPVQKKQWSSVEDPVTFVNKEPIGTGPFTLKTFTSHVITLSKNTDYWKSGKPGVDRVQYLSYDSDSSMISALQGGQVDWIVASNTDPETITKRSPSKFGSWATTFGVGVYLFPNGSSAPTNQPAVRRAINQAIDRSQIAEFALGPKATPAQSPTGLDTESQQDLIASQYSDLRYQDGDSTAAKTTLQEAGYSMGGDGIFVSPNGSPLEISLLVPTTNPYGDWVRAASLLTKQLKAAGIKIKTKPESQVSWRDDVSNGKYQLAMRALGGAPSLYDRFTRLVGQELVPVGKKARINFERYNSSEAKTLLAAMATAEDGSAAYDKALAGLERIMVDEVPVIPLGFPSASGIWRSDKFSGWPSPKDPGGLPIANKPTAVKIAEDVVSK